ncbi:MAG: DNA translocase FtsK [Candidatus Dadabacteria bacterium]|nr:MAG: DNA translocase FtsK [Candidatus Dadabacteria bacterium]
MAQKRKSLLIKARTPPNNKKRKKEEKNSNKKWWDELVATLAVLLSLILLISFLLTKLQKSYYPAQFDTLLNNPLGPIGRKLGVILETMLGWCALLPIGWLTWFGVKTYLDQGENITKQSYNKVISLVLGVPGILLFSAAFSAIFWGENGGGTLGFEIKETVAQYLGTLGAGIVFAGLFILSLALALEKGVIEVLFSLVDLAKFILSFLFLTLPALLFKTALYFKEALFYLINLALKTKELTVPYLVKTVNFFKEIVKSFKESAPEIITPSETADFAPSPSSLTSNIEVETQSNGKPPVKKLLSPRRKKVKVRKRSDSYEPFPLNLLYEPKGRIKEDKDVLKKRSAAIEKKLADFNIQGKVVRIHSGPVITLFEFEPAPNVKVTKITALQDDLSMSLKTSAIRIIAPIPGKGTVGIEVPNSNRETVHIREILEKTSILEREGKSGKKSVLTVALGKDTYGNPVLEDISAMPHLLMAGATGTGKSVCINAILLSLLHRASPDELGLILIDPKVLELSIYEGIPHLRSPVVTEPKQAKAVLRWAVKEMERRYKLMHRFGVRSIDGYNKIILGKENSDSESEEEYRGKLIHLSDELIIHSEQELSEEEGVDNEEALAQKITVEELEPLPKLVIVIDELADLMLTVGKEIELLITKLAQKSRAAGIHLIVATQRPSVDVVTGLIKANFPARISFRVSSRVDSRTVLDCIGAEKLLGNGDMLLLRPGAPHLQRIHGSFVSDQEVKKVVAYLASQDSPRYDEKILKAYEEAEDEEQGSSTGKEQGFEFKNDPLYDSIVEFIVQKGSASVSMIQRRFRIGYNRAARIMDTLEQEGIVGPSEGASKQRKVLLGQNSEFAEE